jgi:hypothetical protein
LSDVVAAPAPKRSLDAIRQAARARLGSRCHG